MAFRWRAMMAFRGSGTVRNRTLYVCDFSGGTPFSGSAHENEKDYTIEESVIFADALGDQIKSVLFLL